MREPVNDWDEIEDATDAPQHHLADNNAAPEDDNPKWHQGDPSPDLNEVDADAGTEG